MRGLQNRRAGAHRSFFIPGATPHYAPDRPFRLRKIILDVAIDPHRKTIEGTATQTVEAVLPGQESITLDQLGLVIEEVKIAGKKASFEQDDKSVTIRLPGAPKAGSSLEFSVRYSAHNPRRGIYFTGPDRDYPDKPYQVWTQGQDEDSRHWFPSFDYPNQKALTEIIATVPKGFTAVANGALVSREVKGKTERFHYRLGTPHVTYLVSLVVAEFAELGAKGPRGLPVQYFVAQGREDEGKRAFGNTPRMIEAFEKKIGVEYPYEKYSQTAVQDFIFGGMENTSSTTQTDLTLHDKRAHLDFSSDPLVSHELAHQWFGDLLTCRDWSHAWLNEGFATFMERVWIENNPGEDGGWEEAKYYSYMDLKEYFDEDGNSYRRPIVCNTYIEPIDLFDRHLYNKGGLVLNLLRHTLGEDLFWKSIGEYVRRFREKNVETLDLIRVIEDVTGRNMRRFFDEWVFGAGYPELEVSYNWHEDKKLAEIVIEQKQTGGKPVVIEEGVSTWLFHLSLAVELVCAGGKKQTHVVATNSARERVFLPAPSKPIMVRLDPDHPTPKTLKFPRPREMLVYQLEKDPDSMGRILAAQELGRTGDPEVVAALGRAAAKDRFWGVQAEAAQVLASIRTDSARDALVAALGCENPKARRAIARALGTFRDEVSAAALKKLAERDASYFVEADATTAWASAAFSPARDADPKALDAAEKFLSRQLEKPAYREVIRAAALRALGSLPGVSRGERGGAIETLIAWSARGKPLDARMAAIDALGGVARTAVPSVSARVFEALGHLADEDNFRVRAILLHALAQTESPHAISIVRRIHASDTDGRIRRGAQTLIAALESGGAMPESVAALRASVERLQEEQRHLRSTLEERGAKSAARGGAGKGAKPVVGKGARRK